MGADDDATGSHRLQPIDRVPDGRETASVSIPKNAREDVQVGVQNRDKDNTSVGATLVVIPDKLRNSERCQGPF